MIGRGFITSVVVGDDRQSVILIMSPIFVLFISLLTIFVDIRNGKSALHLAEGEGHSDIINALRAAGAH